MFYEYLKVIAQGIPTSLALTVGALVIAFIMAVFFTFLLSLNNRVLKSAVKIFVILFT
ncbi:MAG: arginine ABC transporter permease ArtM, partial [[Actinobacillus] rossii]|nr:arginine ABC transporter permease ArtM [[Actinobacillus] rossii]